MRPEPVTRRWAVRVGQRSVTKPWDVTAEHSATRVVRQEANVRPAPGPLARYLRAFPRRRVLWNVAQQLFEIRERDPYTGLDYRVGFVFEYEAPPENTRRAESLEEFEAMREAEAKGPERHLRKVFRPFDDEFVNERLEDDFRSRHGSIGTLSRRVNAHNDALARKKERERRTRIKEWLQEDRRWLGVLQAVQEGKRIDVALTEKVPLVPVGISLAGK